MKRAGSSTARPSSLRVASCCLDLIRPVGCAVLFFLIWMGGVLLFLSSSASDGGAGGAAAAGRLQQQASSSTGRNALRRNGTTGPPPPPPPKRRGGSEPEPAAPSLLDLPEPHLLTNPTNDSAGSSSVTVTASVRGNLGPPAVMLNSGTDWIKDRWQAASDMGGTAIKGHHWVQLEFPPAVTVTGISRIVLDWEAAYCDDYSIEVRSAAGEHDGDDDNKTKEEEKWWVLFDTSNAEDLVRRKAARTGQSPGVKTKTALHVVHDIDLTTAQRPAGGGGGGGGYGYPVRLVRINMRRPAMGWGVSLWKVEVYGWSQEEQA